MKLNYEKQVKKPVQKQLNAIFDSGLERTIVYKKLAGETYDPSQGTSVETYENYEIEAIRTSAALEAQGNTSVLSAIGFETGELVYLIRYSDIEQIQDVYSKEILKDFVVDNGTEFQIKNVLPILDLAVKIQV